MNNLHPAHCVCGNFRSVSRALTSLYDDMLRPSGLLVTQFILISAIFTLEKTAITELADALYMDRTTLARNLRPLEREGLVVVEISEKDRRKRLISLTPFGIKRYGIALPLWETAQQSMLEHINDDRWSDLLASIRSIAEFAKES
jgi:DNA-binding MarR family transcriptional regulator